MLTRLAEALNQAASPEQVVERVRPLLADAAGADWLLVRRVQGDEMTFLAAAGEIPVPVLAGFRVVTRRGESVAWRVVEENRPLYVERYGAAQDALPDLARVYDGAAAILPLRDRAGRPWAVLAVTTAGSRLAWLPATREFLEAAVTIIGNALLLMLEVADRQRVEGELRQANALLDAAHREMSGLALSDSLTGLGNRRAFDADLEAAISTAERLDSSLAVLVADVNNLKEVNDERGHETGDALLRAFARALAGRLRSGDRLYRLGGDEFAAILPHTQPGGIESVRRRVRSAASEVSAAGFAGFGASTGLAVYPQDAVTSGDLVHLADARMYQEKVAHRTARDLRPDARADAPVAAPRTARTTGPHLLLEGLRATLAVLTRDEPPPASFWTALLQVAVAAVPGAEKGSLKVRAGDSFRFQAQVGYSDSLTGLTGVPGADLAWYGLNERLWRNGRPRVLHGAQAIQERSRSVSAASGEALGLAEAGQVERLQANLCVPVVVEGEVAAILNLDSVSSEHAFGREAVRTAGEFAAQVAAILTAHARQLREAARRRELECLVSVGVALREARDEEAVQEVLTRQARTLVATEDAAFMRFDPQRDALLKIAPRGGYQERGPDAIPRGSGLSWLALETHAVVRSDDYGPEARSAAAPDWDANVLLLAPVEASGGEPLGVLAVSRPQDRPYTDLEARLLGAIAFAGAGAIERLRDAATLEGRAAENELLLDLSRLASEAEDARAATRAVLERLRGVLDVRFAGYLEREGDVFAPTALAGKPPELANGLPPERLGELRLTAADLEPLLVPGGGVLAVPSMGFTSPRFFARPQAVAFAAIPIVGAGGMEGLIGLVRDGPREWTTHERELLRAIGHTLSTLLSRLYASEQAVANAARDRAMAELAARLWQVDDPLEVARRGLGTCREFLDHDYGWCYLPEFAAVTTDRDDAACDRRLVEAVREQAPAWAPAFADRHEPFFTMDLTREPWAPEPATAAGARGGVFAPVIAHDRAVGWLILAWSRPLQASPLTALALAQGTAERIGRALERRAAIEDLKATREGALRALGVALEVRDFETSGHTERVVRGALALGRKLGLGEVELDALRQGAYLHDIGKLGVPDAVLLKPDKLDAQEWRVMQAHAELGFALAVGIPSLPEVARLVIRHHHERWDGSGYPAGLSGEEIPLVARVFAVVDVFDALTSARPYKRAWTVDEALAEISAQAGRHFDPAVVEAFLAECENP